MKGEQLRAHFRSDTEEWCTPRLLFAELNRRYRFALDVCATHENAKCDRHFTKAEDGLAQQWAPATCWMNPPYGQEIAKWMRKAYEESQRGATVVCLVPARTDTAWWHAYAMRGQVQFLRGRLRFGPGVGRAPFPSAIVVFVPPAVEVAQRLERIRAEGTSGTYGTLERFDRETAASEGIEYAA